MRNQNPGAQEFRASLLAALNPMLAAEFVPKLTYFDARDRGEVIRLILEETATHYNERRVSIEEWPSVKLNFIIGQLPTYEEGDKFIKNAGNIYRHLARKLKIDGSSEAEKNRCDQAHEILHEAQEKLLTLFWDPEFEVKRESFVHNELFELLHQCEKFMKSNSHDSGYWVGESLTYIDLFAWHVLDCVRPLANKPLENFPDLLNFKRSIENRPHIKAYLESKRRPSRITLPLAFFGGTLQTS